MHSNAQTFRFALIITLVCSILLAAAATLLKPRQEENIQLDIKKNILKSVGLIDPEKDYSREEILNMYEQNIQALVINSNGDIVEGKTPESIDPKVDKDLYPIYENKKEGRILAYIIPISGKGLWSTIYGYLAVEPDGKTVKGITFYQHGETPGLGGEISTNWFQNNFKGKSFVDKNGNMVSITIVKGKVKDKIAADQRYHYVDGISGATLTGRGVTKFLKKNLTTYDAFFKKLRQSSKGVIDG